MCVRVCRLRRLMSANMSARPGRGCTSYAGPCGRIGLGVQNMQSNFFSGVGLRQFVRLSLRIWAFSGLLSLFLPLLTSAVPGPASRKTLQIYFVDVEGGQATLFVTAEGQSLLIDTGWPGNDGRDADRIVARPARINEQRLSFRRDEECGLAAFYVHKIDLEGFTALGPRHSRSQQRQKQTQESRKCPDTKG